jgi:hypothetical protein
MTAFVLTVQLYGRDLSSVLGLFVSYSVIMLKRYRKVLLLLLLLLVCIFIYCIFLILYIFIFNFILFLF